MNDRETRELLVSIAATLREGETLIGKAANRITNAIVDIERDASDGCEDHPVLKRLRVGVQKMREEGECDLRSVLHMIDMEIAGTPLTFDEEMPAGAQSPKDAMRETFLGERKGPFDRSC